MNNSDKLVLAFCIAGLALLISPRIYYEVNKPIKPAEPIAESSEPDRCSGVGVTETTDATTASWYGEPFHGRKTASGEVFDKNALTTAHKSLPFGTVLCVRRWDTGETVRVVVTDRGPFVDGRELDLSEAAFEKIAPLSKGVIKVFYWEDPDGR